MADTKFGFQRILNNVDKLKRTLPVKLANETQNFFVDSWRKQGWDDGSVKAWQPRQKETKKSAGRSILVKSGKLRRAVGQSIRSKTFEKIQLVVALPYAQVHNDGGTVTTKERDQVLRFRPHAYNLQTGKYRGKFVKKNASGARKYGDYSMKVKISATTFQMPQRRFMGDSRTLRTKQLKVIDNEIQRIWQA